MIVSSTLSNKLPWRAIPVLFMAVFQPYGCTKPLSSATSTAAGASTASNTNSSGASASAGTVTLNATIGLDLTSVKGFFIAPSSAVSTLSLSDQLHEQHKSVSTLASSTTTSLYTIKNDNTVSTVNLVSGDNSTININAIYDTQSFLILQNTGITSNGTTCSLIPVRKSDGALFCVSQSPLCGESVGCYFSSIQTDSTGNLIFISSFTGGLTKVDLTNPSNPIQTTLADGVSDGGIWDMAVNSDGDAFVSIVNVSGSARAFRIYKNGGGFQSISTSIDNTCLTNGYAGDDKNFYYIDPSQNPAVMMKLNKISSTFSSATYFSDTSGAVGIDFCSIGGSLYKTSNRLFMGLRPQAHRNYFIEAVNQNNTPTKWTVSAFDQVTKVAGYNGGLVIQGEDSAGNAGITRFDTSNNTFTTVLSPGDYAISSLSVSPAGEITFSGRRSSDNERIIGTVPISSNSVTIVTQTLSADVQQIVRIN